MTRRALVSATLVLACVAVGRGSALQAQVTAGRLISSARDVMESFEFEAAATLLRRALDPGAGASRAERTRALVLLAAAELNASRPDSGRSAARAALALSPEERVDTLDFLHPELVATFAAARAQAAPSPPAPSFLEVRGLPESARLTVDGTAWTGRRQQVLPGLRRIEVTARGYVTLRDSVAVDSGATAIRTLALTAAQPARLSVSSEPWGVVFLDSQRIGETPVFDRSVTAGSYTLTIRSPGGTTVHQRPVELQPGRATNLGTFGVPGVRRVVPSAFARADSVYRSLALDSALVLYRALLRDTLALRDRDQRSQATTRLAVVFYASGRGRGRSADVDSARSLVQLAFRLAPALSPDPSEYGGELRAFIDSARARVLLISLALPSDTLLSLLDGRLPIRVTATHAARLMASVDRAQGVSPPVFARTLDAPGGASSVVWDLKTPDGQVVAEGRYILRITASDSAGATAPAEERRLLIERAPPDTTALPPPLAASAFAPESARVALGPPTALLLGLALGGATVALHATLGNPALNRGMPIEAGVYVAAGSVTVAGIAAFFGGHRVRVLTDNIDANRRLRARDAARRASIIEANTRARQNPRLRVRVEAVQR